MSDRPALSAIEEAATTLTDEDWKDYIEELRASETLAWELDPRRAQCETHPFE